MVDSIEGTPQKRNIAYKLRIGSLFSGRQVIEAEKLRCIEVGDKRVVRVNIIANVTDKYLQEGEKQFGSMTLDDGTGQIKTKVFGEDVAKLVPFQQGDTILIVGLVRAWNGEVYLTPEVMKKKDSAFLLVRKLEVEAEGGGKPMNHEALAQLKEIILNKVKDAEKDGGLDIDSLIVELGQSADAVNSEIKKLLEDGVAYEPRPGRLRYLG